MQVCLCERKTILSFGRQWDVGTLTRFGFFADVRTTGGAEKPFDMQASGPNGCPRLWDVGIPSCWQIGKIMRRSKREGDEVYNDALFILLFYLQRTCMSMHIHCSSPARDLRGQTLRSTGPRKGEKETEIKGRLASRATRPSCAPALALLSN